MVMMKAENPIVARFVQRERLFNDNEDREPPSSHTYVVGAELRDEGNRCSSTEYHKLSSFYVSTNDVLGRMWDSET